MFSRAQKKGVLEARDTLSSIQPCDVQLALSDKEIITVLILGGPAVGKSSLLIKLIQNKFEKHYIPTIGVPQSVDYHESLIMLEKLVKEKVEGVFLIYDDLSILPKWIDHLDWMDKYLEVRTIKKHDFGEWLTKN